VWGAGVFVYVDALWHLPATQFISALVVALASLTAIAWSTKRGSIRHGEAAGSGGAPCSEPALIEAAWALHRASCNERAIATFSDALELNPNSIEALKGRSLCYAEITDYDLAMRDLHRWVLRAPKDGDAYLHRAKLWKELGLDDLAISDLRSSLKFSASNAAAREAVHEMARISFGDNFEDDPAEVETKPTDHVPSLVQSQQATACDGQRPLDEAGEPQQEFTALPPPPPSDSGHTRSDAAGVRDAQAHPA